VSDNDDHASGKDEPRPSASPQGDDSRTNRDLAQRGAEHFRHTRISAAWVSVVVAIVFGVALIDFIAQNTRDVRVDFFTVSGRMPIAVALLVAALAGAVVVVAVGIGRVAQLRLTMRRQRRRHEAEHDQES
jgi:uncharacterized integral membrane protein